MCQALVIRREKTPFCPPGGMSAGSDTSEQIVVRHCFRCANRSEHGGLGGGKGVLDSTVPA